MTKHSLSFLFLKVTVAVFLLFGVLLGVCAQFLWGQHREILFVEKLNSAERILTILSSNVKIPLLADDTLRLTGLVRDAAALEGIVYASVLDQNQVVRAQSLVEDVKWDENIIAQGEVIKKAGGIAVVKYHHPSAGWIYDLSSMISYRGKAIGAVHMGGSAALLEGGVDDALQASRVQSLWVLGAFVILYLVCISSVYTLRVRRRTSALIRAADEYGRGNIQHRLENTLDDEYGDIIRALHIISQRQLSREPSQAQLEQYLKLSSLDRLLESPASQGESYAFRRQVAVLFAGIKGFGSGSGAEDPEKIITALNKYISIVTKLIGKHGGYVDKVVGDAVVGVFGVSLYHENHITRAIRAALDLQKTLSAGSKQESQLLSNVCVGISSGIVLSGNIGSYSKIEYSSIGESIKEAYWLSNLGHPGEILLGEEIINLMEDSVRVEQLPAQKIGGGPEVIHVYRLLSLKEENDELE